MASWPISSMPGTWSSRRPGGATAIGSKSISHSATPSPANGRSARCSTCSSGRTPAAEYTRLAGFTMPDSPRSKTAAHDHVSGHPHRPGTSCERRLGGRHQTHRTTRQLRDRWCPGGCGRGRQLARRRRNAAEWPRHRLVGVPALGQSGRSTMPARGAQNDATARLRSAYRNRLSFGAPSSVADRRQRRRLARDAALVVPTFGVRVMGAAHRHLEDVQGRGL
jgi:hypothetical protein